MEGRNIFDSLEPPDLFYDCNAERDMNGKKIIP